VLSLEVGAAAPALSLVDRAGKAVDLGTFGGRPVLLNFLSTTCAPCAAELPLLSAAQQQYGRALDVVLVGVLDTPDDLATFAADHEAATLSQLIDPHGATARAYHIGLIPSSVFLDAQAQIATTHVGVLDSSSLAAALAKAGMPTTGGGPVTLPATTAPGVPPCCPVPGGD
jgi:peroxiredoxin